jgi:cell wall-associated NlpC family hydrolase
MHCKGLNLPRLGAVLVVGVAAITLAPAVSAAGQKHSGATTTTTTATTTSGYTLVRASSPARTLVKTSSGSLVATFTDGARTAVLSGPTRTFAEPSTTSASVSTQLWVRMLPAPFAGSVDLAWLDAALADRSPDVLAVAAQYTTGAPDLSDSSGARLAGDASYGPIVDGTRQEGSDWNDYYGVTATYGGVSDAPEPSQLGALDCSGFVRAVFGRRLGFPLTLNPDGVRLPRRATQMATSAPGTVVVVNSGAQVTSFSRLLPGDLVLFDASTDDGTAIDHVGIYLGKDSVGRQRFVSSRKTVDGPTMGDVGGPSRLDGTALYARSFRSVHRL